MSNGSRVSVQLLSEIRKGTVYVKQGFKIVPHEYCGPALRKIIYKNSFIRRREQYVFNM